jgi:hypothetical protein
MELSGISGVGVGVGEGVGVAVGVAVGDGVNVAVAAIAVGVADGVPLCVDVGACSGEPSDEHPASVKRPPPASVWRTVRRRIG